MPAKHIVQKGEGLSKLAQRYGFAPETIWEHPRNAELKKLRRDGNILLPGDELWIPDKTPKDVTASTGARHRFRLKGVPAKLRLQVFKNEEPRKGLSYRLVVDGSELLGTTDGDGFLEVYVSPGAERGQLFLGDERPITIRFGSLAPAGELLGVQNRLRNLGFFRGPCDGASSRRLRSAVAAFQARCGLPPTGEIDDTTRARLRAIHDDKEVFPSNQAAPEDEQGTGEAAPGPPPDEEPRP
ncbi:peptidoglycan-binding protein [Sorangium sp. So ce1099]|uniref:peptidoglycan-binding protein n=1 Tax=Sorangium sp. So ce1099 TaxID=3133331 RepID=UPI003F609E27